MSWLIVDVNLFYFSLLISSGIFFTCFIIFSHQLDKQKKYERNAYQHLISASEVDCCVVVVVKNEGDTIVNTIENILSFPENLHVLVYDDNTTDDSIERLKEMGAKFGNRVEVRKLLKRDLFVHPKAFGTEDAFNTVKTDLFLVIDADTIITHSDFIKAVSALKNEKIDVLHIARRNDKKNSIVDKLADKEELMNMAFHLTKFNNHQFGGSGYFVKSEIVRGLKYQKGITSEDTYVLKYVRERGAKIRFFFTLFAHERAPNNYLSMIKQRINWLNQSTPFFMNYFLLVLTFAHILFSFSFAGMLNPLSIGFVFTSLTVSVVLAIEIVIAIKILGQNPLKAFLYTFLLILNMIIVMWPIYIVLIIRSTLRNSQYKIVKNQ